MGGNEAKHSREQGGIVGEAEAHDHVGDEIEGQDEIRERRKEHTPDAHRRCRVERAVIGRNEVLDERHAPGKALELGPKVAADLPLPFGKSR